MRQNRPRRTNLHDAYQKDIDRNDIASLTMEASRITGIPHVSDIDAEEVNEILDGVEARSLSAAD